MDQKNINEQVKKSNVFVEDRKKVTITGVIEVVSFDEEKVLLSTILDKLEIVGNNLKICNLDIKNGEVSISGTIHECKYLGDRKSKNANNKLFKKFIGKKVDWFK